ncbi:mitochondrial glycoprotein [Mycena albidolilacea]|uniref:Mitochondrial glycoprotein n=1 Tax=Mycena albidolilacea TaxID=1033008 RepID=A0AAD6Z685_9AGAR|nr:mitochondrial glycoprotein [Mycena albidolilacea]
MPVANTLFASHVCPPTVLRTVRQLTKLRPVLRAARPTVGAARARGFAVHRRSKAVISLHPRRLVQQDDVQVGAVPQDLAGFLQKGGWEIKDTLANDEVFLTRKFGDENIRVMFSIADLQSIPDEDEPEPEATDDEGPARGDGGAAHSTHPGALHADLHRADSAFDVANVAYGRARRDGAEHRERLGEKDVVDRAVALNDAFETYLRERGVDGALAGFVPRYALWKEQRGESRPGEQIGKGRMRKEPEEHTRATTPFRFVQTLQGFESYIRGLCCGLTPKFTPSHSRTPRPTERTTNQRPGDRDGCFRSVSDSTSTMHYANLV